MIKTKAIQIESTGGPDVLKLVDLGLPAPTQDQIVVKNSFVGVNYIDTYFRRGMYPANLPHILGREAAGEIIETGSNIIEFKKGDRIAYLFGDAYSEYVLLQKIIPKDEVLPPDISDKVGAAALLQGLTALTLIREAYQAKKGDYILVHAAAGGMGLQLCQLLSSLGAHVIGTTSTSEKAALAQSNGAEFIINYTTEDVVEKVKEITNGVGVDAVLDGVGKDTFETSLECVKRKGTLISFGSASGVVPPISISRLSPKNVKLLRPSLFGYITTKAEWDRHSTDLIQLLQNGSLKIRIHEIYPLGEASRAHIDLESRGTTGKLLLQPYISQKYIA
ncbi:putative quinone oxidoreductase [Neolecta irregularis DAH-3]|uniref:Probable quinone oxidoreductase n=1 Tax=Neolecta irregularis (strain DAH-3) TaxID=1198029 RepID=A0A1U7LNJ6_NEOID|nr:putative quinone oxidoreductase [Neolecta irregularis DAH-3]|eukprot:OLL24163.1 putative quinone oxidoreductase [Neolecta irregularis DAH-3]